MTGIPTRLALVAAALLVGSFNGIEAGTNTLLRKTAAAPIWSVAIVSLATLAGSVAVALAVGERWPDVAALRAMPWWGWSGGLLGLGFVLAMVLVAEPLGAALFIGCTVTAATVTSLVLDHFGWLGFTVHPAGIGRIAGGILMIAGVALIAAF